MKVIVGGGPNGLYLAIKLYQAGVKDILVVDPRAGHYTRPGHIIGEAFEHAEDSLGVLFSDSDEPISFGHIKDIERVLYSHAVSLGIDICAQKFVGLRKGSQKRLPCVILEEAGKTNLVPVEYLFDCSGTKRVVINAVNDLMSPASPFRVTPMTEVAVKKHALMYVRMPDADFEDLRLAREHQFELNDADDPCRYVQSIEQLRAFGWQEVGYPQYSVWPSGKGKVGLYSEVSPTLRDEDVLAWMTLLFEREVPSKVARFEVLPNPRAKPRITTFSVFPHELHRFSYQHPDLPMIIAHGDAHIERAHAI